MKRYLYTFTRQDIRPEQQLVQTAHIAFKLGDKCGRDTSKYSDPDDTYFVCVGVRNLDALLAVEKILYKFNFNFEVFYEPDIGNSEMTAIAVYPIDEDKKDILLAFNLLKF